MSAWHDGFPLHMLPRSAYVTKGYLQYKLSGAKDWDVTEGLAQITLNRSSAGVDFWCIY